MDKLHVKVLTPAGTSFEGHVDYARLATADGLLEVHSRHADLVGTLGFSHLWLGSGEHTEHFLIRHGLLSMDNVANEARVMVFDCQKRESADVKTLREYFDMLHDLLKGGQHGKTQARFLAGEISSMEKFIEVVSDKGEPASRP